MYYSYVEIEYVATSFSPARMDLALKLLNMGLVLVTEGKLHQQTKMYAPSQQCVEVNGAGARVSNNRKWTNKSAVGYGSNNLPNRPAFWFWKTRRNWYKLLPYRTWFKNHLKDQFALS
jgi:hypothetical protein